MPKTILGKWSLGLILAMFALIALGSSLTNSLYESVSAGGTIFADIISRPALVISMLVGFGAGISSFVIGLVSIIKQKERSLLVYVATIIGAFLTVLLISEFLFPH
jgi:hypothetical protein